MGFLMVFTFRVPQRRHQIFKGGFVMMYLAARLHRKWRQGLLLLCTLAIMMPPALIAAPAHAGALNSTASDAPDAFEEDDSCADANSISADGTEQQRNLFQDSGPDQDWVSFAVVSGKRYEVNAAPAATGGEDVDIAMVLYPQCDDVEVTRSDEKLKFQAVVDGTYFVKIKHAQDEYGDNTEYVLSVTAKDPPPQMIPLSETPVKFARRATDFLDEVRGSEVAPNWVDARFASTVYVLYRPDMGDEPAYYEFCVEAPDSDGVFQPAGFVQLSTSDHDYPITHWNNEGRSPAQELEGLASLSEGEISQYYKIDVLSYTAEYDQPAALGVSVQAADIVRLGNLPPKAPEDLPLPLDGEPIIENGTWDPEIGDDTEVDPDNPVSTTLVVDGDDIPLALADENWEDWNDLKKGYTANYGTLLAALKQDANPEWEFENLIETEGEALVIGDIRTVRGLSGRTLSDISVTGEGAAAEYLEQTEINENGSVSGVVLTVLAAPSDPKVSLPISVSMSYEDGAQEAKLFTLVRDTDNDVFLPLITRTGATNSAAVKAASADATQAVSGRWSSWRYWWAASPWAASIKYNQLPANFSPNNKPCWSGCVPTAWAMMFAWADIRATIPNSGWGHRWGIYRRNGGYGANAVAPLPMYGASESGGIHNVMMELNTHMGTFCTSDASGATYTSRMHDAWKYLRNRTGAKLRYKRTGGWWIFGTSGDEVRDYAINTVKSGRPVVIAREGHAPLVLGYRERSRKVKSCFLFFCKTKTERKREFYVNQGWGGSSNGWVSAKASFAGTLTPN